MDNLSHSRRPNPKVITNGGGGFLAKTLYDDVYGGPPKFGLSSSSCSSLSPRLEDYSEIFGAFSSSRASSIPVLQLPVADDDENDEFFDVRSSGFDYSEVFGGFDGLDFAVAYDDLVKQKHDGAGDGDSSDEAWTPEGSGSVSGESNHSLKNQIFSDGDPYYSFNGSSEFGISYNKAHKKSNKESLNGKTHANPVPAASAYRYMPDEITPMQHTKFDNPSLQVTDDRKFDMYSNVEMVNEKHLRKTVSLPFNGSSAEQAYGDSQKPERGSGRNGSRHKEPFVTISDINLRTQPSHLPPPWRPPPIVDGNSGDSGRLSSNSNTISSDERSGDISPPFFDVEVDASSSAAVSAAAMKEAMEKARIQLRSAKELMQRKKEGSHSRSKSRSKKENKEEGKVGKFDDGSSSKKDDRVQGTTEREDSRMKFAVSEEKQKVLKKVREDPESLEAAKNLVQEKHAKGSWSSQGSFQIDEASEWQEATQYFELVALDDTKKAFELANKDKILVQTAKADKKVSAAIEVHDPEDLEKKRRELEECNARSKDAKESQGWKEHEKMVKVTRETIDKGENETSLGTGKLPAESVKQRVRSAKSEKYDNMAEIQGKENKFNVENAMQQKDNEAKLKENDKAIRIEERHKESHGREGIENRQKTLEHEENERRLEEALTQAENEKRLKEVLEKEENEKRLKEAQEQEENEKRLKKAIELQENEKKLKEALEQENKKRQKEAAQREENEKRLKEFLEKEEIEKRLKEETEQRLKKALELQENEKRIKEALEQENKRRQKEAAQREENEKRLKEALEFEEYQKRLKDGREREENERRLKMAHAREQQYAMNRLKESQEKAYQQAEIQQKLDEASVLDETKKNIKVADDREEVEVLNKTQKGTERNENVQELRSVKGTHLPMEEVEDHKLSDETCNQDCNENSQATQIARNYDENSETLKEYQEEHAHEENGKKKSNNKHSDTMSGPEVVEPVKMSLDLENKEKQFRRKNADESLPLDPSVKKTREEIIAEPRVRKGETGGVKMTNGPVDEQFKASFLSGLTQVGTESGKSYFRMDDAYESIPFVNFVKKAVEASSGTEKPQPQFNSTSQKDFDHETQKMECAQEWKEREKDSKQVHASSNREENLAAEPVKEFVDSRRKTEAACPAMAEINNRKSSQQVDASQAPGRKVNNLKEDPLNGEKETERLKRERELENDRLRKIEEEREREREREKDRMAVDRATLEARDCAYVEARERAERVALERATADARQRAMSEARERLEKACAEAREKSLAGKAAMEARLKAERAAVERATAEARERAAEKLMAERERVQRSVSDKFSASSRNNGLRHCSSSSDLQDPQKPRHPYSTAYGERYEGEEGESAQRCKARLERHARTAERAAKALAEKNMRDLLAQREQAERNRLAETLDADVKRWSSGKEGNLRALLSTLQYILGSDSGWQPIPLTEVITAAAVKKAYRKATLCVHPDKLQQRGASIHQKYTCEKVFDLLKEAWNKFNSEERSGLRLSLLLLPVIFSEMPTFSVIALDRLLEPGASSKSADMSVPIPKPVSHSMPVPEGLTKLERRNSTSVMEGRKSTSVMERKPHRPPIRPALYATPETTSLPDSPTSFPPSSPYIVNHKRRGPRLLKSYSEQDVSLHRKSGDEEKLNGSLHQKSGDKEKLNGTTDIAEAKVETSPVDDSLTFTVPKPSQVQHSNGLHPIGSSNGNPETSNGVLRSSDVELGTSSMTNGSAREDDLFQQGAMASERDSDRDDFLDPKDSMSVTSNTDGEGNAGAERSVPIGIPAGEFYDAWEELSSEGGHSQQLSGCDLETELREMKLSLVMEIEKRKQAEESLNNLRNQWQRIREQLSLVGLTLPADPTVTIDHEQLGSDPVGELGQQLYLARFVSNSIGRAIARAEMEAELEDQIEAKNFEIARLCDKLHNYEAMNQEMVQRNQDVIELARRDREKKAKRQRWVWGSIAAALTLGTAALAYSYNPSGRGSPTYHSEASGSDK
ncbi:hypothetical protein ACLB2K_005775 [Fragaria x ananassa]